MIVRELPVHLNTDEVAAKASELASKLQEQAEKAEEAKNVAASFKDALKEIDKQITELAAMVRDHIEYRPVNCTEVRNDLDLTITVVRMDTGERVSVRAMTDSERQLRMFPREVETEQDVPGVAEGDKSDGQ